MTDDKKLYPLQFCSLEDKYAWGSEVFGLADLGYRDSLVRSGWLAANSMSEVMETYLDRVVGEEVYSRYGRQFPVQVKTITVEGRMPLKVHPDDVLSADRYDALGKEKFWYVLNAQADAALYLGFNRQMDASSLMAGCEDGSIVESLLRVVPKAGDCWRIAPGTVHCAEGHMTIVEVSESSALDFCLTAWGNPVAEDEFDPEQNIIEALDFIDYAPNGLEELPLETFSVRKISLSDPLDVQTQDYDSFLLYYCLYGGAKFTVEESSMEMSFQLAAGQTMLIPSEVERFVLSSAEQSAALLEIMIPHHDVRDAYIDPDAEAVVPGEESDEQ